MQKYLVVINITEIVEGNSSANVEKEASIVPGKSKIKQFAH